MAPPRSRKASTSPQLAWGRLQLELTDFLRQVDWAALRQNDPVNLVWPYDDAADQEVAGLIVATMAYGRVSLLKKAASAVLMKLGPHPAEMLRGRHDDTPLMPEDFVYRMTRGEDINALCVAIGRTLREEGSLLKLFQKGLTGQETDYQDALGDFVHILRQRGESERRGFRYLLADPRTGGACKRLNLFLRWMIRGPDQIDLGTWSRALDPAKLVMPLDTHIVRICSYIGLTERKTSDWKMAREIANNLSRLDERDPLKYDFALCHLGISGACPRKPVAEICATCPIQRICRL